MSVHHMIRLARPLAILLVAGVGSASAQDQDQGARLRQGGVATQLSPQISEPLQDFLQSGQGRPALEFKVPVEFDVETICYFSAGVIQCETVVVNRHCPETVAVRDLSGHVQQVEVICSGPNNDGTCDCDFVEGE